MRWLFGQPMLGLLLPLVVGIVVLTETGVRSEWGRRDRKEAYYEYYANKELRNRPNQPRYSAEHWRQKLLARYRETGIGTEELGTVEALTLGYRDDLDQEIKTHFSRSGAMHILAVSGMHVGILYGFLFFLLTLGGRLKPMYEERRWQCVVSLTIMLLMGLYAWLTGLAASVVRSVLMCMMVEVARMAKRDVFSMNTLFAAAFLILCFRPSDLYSVGFQLSFAAVAALLILGPKARNYWWNLVLVSVAAQMGTLPLSLYYFGQMSNYFILSNVVVMPLAGALMIMAVLFFLLGWIPLVGEVLALLMHWTTWLMHSWTEWVDSLPGAVTELTVTGPMVALLYGMAVTGILSMKKSLWWLAGTAGCAVGFCILYIR